MENKYFTPDIEDMSVGCEFEMDDTWGGWRKLTLTKELLANPMVGLGSGNERSPWYHRIRVSYLTKEQIIAEGYLQTNRRFHYEESGIVYTITENEFRKENIEVTYTEGSTNMIITDYDVAEYGNLGTIYMGECKDINTFKKIIKLLGI